MTFILISNSGKKLKIKVMILKLEDSDADQIKGGVAGACITHIAFGASVGGLFGGVGAIVGAVAAASGPACLGLW